jgi:hypothetical protein
MSLALQGIFTWAADRQDYFHYWVGSTLYTDWNTAVLRNLLTTVFIILGLLILASGSYYVKTHNKRRLLRGERVPVSHLTGWLSLFDVVSYICSTCRLPGGSLGLVMLITGAFSLAHQYFVNSFIQPCVINTTCKFDSGIAALTPTPLSAPSSTLSSATTIYNAQLSSYYNGGIQGIYRLVPFYSYYFRPTQHDLLGYWSCNASGSTLITSADWQSQNSLVDFLRASGLLNPNGAWTGTYLSNGSFNGFLSWFTNQVDNSTAWDTVQASMAFGLTGTSITLSEWTCTLQPLNGWNPPVIAGSLALQEWAPKAYGYLMDSSPTDYGVGLELMLNAMFMAAAGGNVDQTTASQLPAGEDLTYGCALPGTQIMVGIWVILGAFLVTSLLLLFCCFIAIFQSSRGLRDLPTSVSDWHAALVRALSNNDNINAMKLRKFLAAGGNDGRLKVGTSEDLDVRQLSTFTIYLYLYTC